MNKFRAATFAMIIATAGFAFAQTAPAPAPATATPKPKKPTWQDKYNSRVDQIKKDIAALPADTSGTIVMLGDSITHGFFSNKAMPKEINGHTVINQGISGDRIDRQPEDGTGVVHRIDLIQQAKPVAVFVMIGINDYWGGKGTPEEVIPRYEKMVPMLKAAVPNAKVVLESVLPTSKTNAYMNPNVDKLNTRIKQLAAENGFTYLDLHPVMEDENGELKAEFTKDGVHLNNAAYAVWLKELKKTLDSVLK